MGLLSRPRLLVEIELEKFPASAGTQVIRLTSIQHPISMEGKFYQPRVKSFGAIKRAATDPDGNYSVGSVDFVIADDDGAISELMRAGTETEYWDAREISVWVISQEGLDAGLTTDDLPPVFRGWITNYQKKRRDVNLSAGDVLGSQMSGFNLDKKVLQVPVKMLNPDALDNDKDLYLPIYLGELTTRGLTDANGENADFGAVPVIEIGVTRLGGGDPVQTFADPPVITSSGVVGATDGPTVYLAATVITSLGESRLSNVVQLATANTQNVNNYSWIQGTYDNGGVSPYNRVRIWISDNGTTWTSWLDEANYIPPTPGVFGYALGAAPFQGVGTVTRDEPESRKDGTPPDVSTAGLDPAIYSIMGINLGYSYHILNLFGSDLAETGNPKRAALPAEAYGSTTITPDDAAWPFPDPWIELNGIRFTGFLQNGPVLNAHRDRSITMAANVCGPNYDDLLVNQAFRQLQVLLNEFCLKNKGTGFTNVDYGTLETYANGDALLQTTTFEACQDLSKTFMGDDVGYIGTIWIVDPEETWRDVMQRFLLSFGCRLYPNRFGQLACLLLDTTPDDVLGRHFRERIEIKRSEDPNLAHDQVINSFQYNYFYHVDAQKYIGTGSAPDDTSIAAHVPGGVVGGTDRRGLREVTRDMAYVTDKATVVDVINRELIRRQRRQRYITETVPMLGLDFDIAGRGRITDTEGLGTAGDVATRVVILEHETHLQDEEVTLTFLDLNNMQIVPGAGPDIGEGPSIGGEIGDETLSAPDPDAAQPIGDETSVPVTAQVVG